MTPMMMTSAKMPPIVGPIMIPMFVDLDVGDPNIGFPGAYLQVFTFTHLSNFTHTKDNRYQFIGFKINHHPKHKTCLCNLDNAKYLDLWFKTYVKVQVLLWEMKLGGMGPLKLLFCISLFHMVESPMSLLVWSSSSLLDFFIQM